jgi:hypothetical protein
MRDDEEQARHYAPLLRRVIILVTVLIAVPVILWTITAFVRAYVGPPKIPAFRQITAMVEASGKAKSDAGGLLQWAEAKLSAPSAAMVDASGKAKSDAGGLLQWATEKARLSAPSAATVQAKATATDTPSASAPAKEPPLADRAPDGGTNMPPSGMKTADASLAPVSARPTDMPAVPAKPDGMTPNMGPPAVQQTALLQPAAAQTMPAPAAAQPAATLPPAAQPTTAQPTTAQPTAVQQTAAQQTTAAVPPPANTVPAAQPLAGRIPLPRHRPADFAMVRITAANVPMPRPRPDSASAGSEAPSETTTSAGPLDFLQGLFH